MSDLSEELAKHFLAHDYKWKFDYGLANPDADDIDKALTKATMILEPEEDNTQLEIGRLLLKKRAGVIDVFVLAGTIGETKNEDGNL